MRSIVVLLALITLFNLVLAKPPHHHHHGPSSGPKKWALLVAGSNTYFNYRHQADICHAYHIMRAHGIPDERIVTMMYDDIAFSKYNPTPGVIVNFPNGSNVYAGVKKDYTGKDVNPTNFLNILQGKKSAMQGKGSGQVIDSGPDDHVFVYYADHGAPGLVAFPDGKLLHARNLNKALIDMHESKKFKKLVFYLEACESGSMFEKHLPNDIDVYAVTAANSTNSSYACYLDMFRKTFLGDLFSVKWMEDSDAKNLDKETLQKQYQIVRRETNMSRVMQYGDLSITAKTVGQFQGTKQPENTTQLPNVPFTAVRSEDVKLTVLRKRVEWAESDDELEEAVSDLHNEVKDRRVIADTMLAIARHATRSIAQTTRVLQDRRHLTQYDCYEPLVQQFSDNCFHFGKHEHALRHLYALVNMCEDHIPHYVIQAAINHVCKPQTKQSASRNQDAFQIL